MRVSLSKALKLKNRLVQRVNALSEDVRQYNRYRVATGPELDVREALERRSLAAERLALLKALIGDANSPVRADIYRLGELKSLATLVKSIGGPVPFNPYAQTEEADRWATTLQKADIDERLAGIEREIDLLQDKLDAFNATTFVELPWEDE